MFDGDNSSGRYFLCSEMIFNLAKSLTASPFFKCCENLASSKSISPCFPTTAMSASIWQWIQYKHWKWIQYKQHLPCISFLVHLIKVHARVQVPFTQKPTKLVDCNIKYIYLAYHATSKHANEDKVTAPKLNHNKHDNNFHKLQSLSIWDPSKHNEIKESRYKNIGCRTFSHASFSVFIISPYGH